MTKKEIISELNKMGEFHFDMASWSKSRLMNYMNGCKKAKSMPTEELIAMIKARTQGN